MRAHSSVADAGGAAAAPSVQRRRPGDARAVQRAHGPTPLALGHRGLADLLPSGSGRPLDDHVRQDMEARLGADLSGVRVHTGDQGHRAARALGARAFTTGTDIVFAHGAYDPSAATGRATLAHELVHVLQQREGPVDGTDTGAGLRISDPGDRFEREATDVAARVDVRPAPGPHVALSRPVARGSFDARTVLRLQRAAGNHATARALAGRPVLQRCGPTPCDCPGEQQHAATLEQVPVQRRGDVTATSIGDAYASALSDAELADDLRLVRAQVRTLRADDPVHSAATQNLQVLEREQRRRVTRQPGATGSTRPTGPSSATSPTGQTVPRPPGLPVDRGYRLVPVDGLPSQLLDAIPDGQLVQLDLAGPGGPSPVPAGPARRSGLDVGDITPVTQPLGVGGVAALRGSNTALRTFGFAAAGSDSIGLVAIPSVQANPLKPHWTLPDPAAPLDFWGHTAITVRRNGRIVAVRGFNPDSGFPRGLLELLRQRRAVEAGRAALPAVVSADDYLLTHPRARTLEWAVTPELAESALHELSPTGRAGALGHADLYSAQPAEYGCTGSNCGLWATEQVQSRLGAAVGRTGQGPITAVGANGATVPRTASQGRLMGLLGEAEQARLSGGPSPLLEMPHAQGPGVASGVPRAFKVLKYGGRVFAVVGVAADAYELYSATPSGRPRVAVGIAGATVGGAAGGALAGAAAGLVCGPGAPVCSVVLGAGGAVLGALGGRAALQALFDSFGSPQAGPCVPAYRRLGPAGAGECPSCHRIRRVQECRDEDRLRFGAGGGSAPFGAGVRSWSGPADQGLRTSWRTDELRSLLVAGERSGPPGIHSLSAQETQLLLQWISSGR